jgi:hypothetical protein
MKDGPGPTFSKTPRPGALDATAAATVRSEAIEMYGLDDSAEKQLADSPQTHRENIDD